MMRCLLLVLSCFILQFSFAQNPDSTKGKTGGEGLRLSLITVGVGQDLYASFGHAGVRITDSARGTDEVYNYGTFYFSDNNFYVKFTLGKLLYYIDKGSYTDFIAEYHEEKRSVKEQVLNLPGKQKEAIRQYLETNLQPANRAYHYDFLFDNCATRIRDIFPKVLGNKFYWGEVMGKKKISYRQVLNRYLANKHWERFGINLLLGSPVDSIMTESGSMFLPDFLHKGMEGASYDNHDIVQKENIIIPQGPLPLRTLNGPLWMMIGILILTVLSFQVKAFRYLKPVIRFILLFTTGLLGLFMLFMWLFTDHYSCSGNYNILWALPTNIIVAFMAGRKNDFLRIYGLAAISILIVALIVHVIGIQRMPLIEIAPLLLCLMYVYIDLYKTNITIPENKAP
jgi:hypothetical protein